MFQAAIIPNGESLVLVVGGKKTVLTSIVKLFTSINDEHKHVEGSSGDTKRLLSKSSKIVVKI